MLSKKLQKMQITTEGDLVSVIYESICNFQEYNKDITLRVVMYKRLVAVLYYKRRRQQWFFQYPKNHKPQPISLEEIKEILYTVKPDQSNGNVWNRRRRIT